MARIDWIEERLHRWAQWLNVGDGSGYPTTSVLHPDWFPPSPGQSATIKVSSHTDVRATHRAIAGLSQRLGNTLVLHYCIKPPMAEQARRLECAEVTVYGRIDLAHRLLARQLGCE